MKAFASLAVLAAFAASAAASPAGVSENMNIRRRITAKLSLCEAANLQNCDDTFVPIDTCYRVNDCTVHSLNTGGHICDFYSERGCGGHKYQHWGIQEDLPDGVLIRSVFCW
ncbi:hypothetical protein JDV02_001977 [Purpureocillium takamizusanense]|uniref:Uncharacterized protein n=1 Tax=Purpureocillium takamizusanense TaxID=2060973 RepID=A0A9Q8Q8B6_9HYPO|nr:uncharacterized protein JDV02_001977 [Purpureocillium takamizusanense]UNI15443.1 hypothetical protein JDV02_001977 [Purpureocillium takamizusanense]